MYFKHNISRKSAVQLLLFDVNFFLVCFCKTNFDVFTTFSELSVLKGNVLFVVILRLHTKTMGTCKKKSIPYRWFLHKCLPTKISKISTFDIFEFSILGFNQKLKEGLSLRRARNDISGTRIHISLVEGLFVFVIVVQDELPDFQISEILRQ